MAKGSFNGVIRGKKGNSVFYSITNSNNKEKQGIREYQPVVSNPQSDGQIDQRVKMQAVNNLYRALKPIITRGWENHKYGDPSRRAFLKKALGASFEGPYIVKGSTLAVPIKNVPIMYGSLTPIECIPSSLNCLIMVPCEDGDPAGTFGDLSEIFINSGYAVAGDQITMVFCWRNDGGIVVYKTIDFIVDTQDTRRTEDTTGFSFGTTAYEDAYYLSLVDVPNGCDFYNYGILLSVSRDGDGQHLRSYAEFAMTQSFQAYFYGNAEQNAAAKRSYKRNVSASTNWEQVPGDDVIALGNTIGVINSSDPTAVIITGFRVQDGYAQVYDSNSSIWRYVYATGVQGSSYHKWLTGNKTSAAMWSSDAPDGANAAQAIRFSASNDANESDLIFAQWLNDQVGYVGYYLFR